MAQRNYRITHKPAKGMLCDKNQHGSGVGVEMWPFPLLWLLAFTNVLYDFASCEHTFNATQVHNALHSACPNRWALNQSQSKHNMHITSTFNNKIPTKSVHQKRICSCSWDSLSVIDCTYFNFGCTVKMICARGGAQSTFPRSRFCTHKQACKFNIQIPTAVFDDHLSLKLANRKRKPISLNNGELLLYCQWGKEGKEKEGNGRRWQRMLLLTLLHVGRLGGADLQNLANIKGNNIYWRVPFHSLPFPCSLFSVLFYPSSSSPSLPVPPVFLTPPSPFPFRSLPFPCTSLATLSHPSISFFPHWQ